MSTFCVSIKCTADTQRTSYNSVGMKIFYILKLGFNLLLTYSSRSGVTSVLDTMAK